MSRDERRYADPAAFRPERYTPAAEGGAGEPFPAGHFGYGRRACVGRFLADNSFWAMAATLLATVRFGKKLDARGSLVEPRVAFTNGGTWCVLPPARPAGW